MDKSDIVHIFLQFSSQIKLYHWQTTSYPRHKASDNLFLEMQDLIDKFIETYQGKFSRIMLKKEHLIPIFNLNDKNILDYLLNFKIFLVEDLEDFLKGGNSDLLNIRDEMVGLVNQTLYLFTFN